MDKLETKIESVLFFQNEPISLARLSLQVGASLDEVKRVLKSLTDFYEKRGIVLISDGEYASFGTHPDNSDLIEKLQKEEMSGELSRAALETLAIILYKGPISRREIDHIRGVNSGFILHALLVRGLIERAESTDKSYSYKATLKLLEHLGVTSRENLPEFETAFKKIEEFVRASETAEPQDE